MLLSSVGVAKESTLPSSPVIAKAVQGEATETQVQSTAVARIHHLVKKGIIDQSWQSDIVLQSIQLEKKTRDDVEVWVVHFKNKNREKNPVNKVLYVFVTLSGDYLAAKFTEK